MDRLVASLVLVALAGAASAPDVGAQASAPTDTPQGRVAVAASPPVATSSARRDSAKVRWALALSGGLARGLGHIGVLRALEERGLRPDLIVGTSMGSLVGALWASGRTSRQIHDRFRRVDVQGLFEPRADGYEWRRLRLPRPWLTLFGGRLVSLPTGMMDDAAMADLIVREVIDAEALAQGRFDRMVVPWRAVATDVNTFVPVRLDSGSVARAVRASVSLPVVFPSVSIDGRLLADGGLSHHLPMAEAAADTLDHVLGVDVGRELPRLDERSDVLRVGASVAERIARGGRTGARPGRDHILDLPMPGVSQANFAAVDVVVEAGYREAHRTIDSLARVWRLPRAASPETAITLPPLSRRTWIDAQGRSGRGAGAAERVGRPWPRGPFAPDDLAKGLGRVHRGDVFRSAWPVIRSRADSTWVTLEVRDHPGVDVGLAAAYDNDDGSRLNATASLRPFVLGQPTRVLFGGIVRGLGAEAFAGLEPRSLARGATGPFVRGGARSRDVRRFDRDGERDRVRIERGEALAGAQWFLPSGDVVQAGAGVARVWAEGTTAEGGLAAFRMEATGARPRRLEAVAMSGASRYAAASGSLGLELASRAGSLRPTVIAGWASPGAPRDEQPALGGPTTLAGLNHDEWLGRRALGLELRFVRHVFSALDVAVYAQSGWVEKAWSRPDLDGHRRIAAGAGAQVRMPFGPLAVDWGIAEGGEFRVDLAFGPGF